MEAVEQIASAALERIGSAASLAELEELRVRALGKKGEFTALLKELGQLDPEARRARGATINAAKERVEAALAERRALLEEAELARKLAAERVDVSLPGRRQSVGSLHPVTRSIERMEQIFGAAGFRVVEGPEIEDDWHN
ncbi:MAG: phenylalanine--tRNA ligase subunit alpha, partial [Gammaproteobacteria bacterium]